MSQMMSDRVITEQNRQALVSSVCVFGIDIQDAYAVHTCCQDLDIQD